MAVCFPEFFKFLCAFAFWDAASGGLIGLFLLYINVQLEMYSAGLFILITIFFGIPGAIMMRCISSGSIAAVKKGCIFWIVWFMFTALSFVAVCYGPEHQGLSYLWAPITGLGASRAPSFLRERFACLTVCEPALPRPAKPSELSCPHNAPS